MSLIKDITSATSAEPKAADVSSRPKKLFGNLIKRDLPGAANQDTEDKDAKTKGQVKLPTLSNVVKSTITPPTPVKVVTAADIKKARVEEHQTTRLGAIFDILRETEEQTQVDVMTRLKNMTTGQHHDRYDTRKFGLNDASGATTVITVPDEQAREFEAALQSYLGDTNPDGSGPEIAEIVFNLKDQFDILDVEWPNIEEDEEVDQRATSNDQEQVDIEGDDIDVEADFDGDDMDVDADLGADVEDAPASTEQMLQDLIALMRADADTRRKEAEVAAAEARNREQELANRNITARVRQEEQMLDMEAEQRAQKDEEKEVQRLSKLSQWESNIADKQGVEDEERWDNGYSDDLDRAGAKRREPQTQKTVKPAQKQPKSPMGEEDEAAGGAIASGFGVDDKPAKNRARPTPRRHKVPKMANPGPRSRPMKLVAQQLLRSK